LNEVGAEEDPEEKKQIDEKNNQDNQRKEELE
jgi:hypothetical protein